MKADLDNAVMWMRVIVMPERNQTNKRILCHLHVPTSTNCLAQVFVDDESDGVV